MKPFSETIGFPQPSIIPVNGIALEVFEAGQQNASNPIAFCHEWTEHAFTWRHQIPALAKASYHVIATHQVEMIQKIMRNN